MQGAFLRAASPRRGHASYATLGACDLRSYRTRFNRADRKEELLAQLSELEAAIAESALQDVEINFPEQKCDKLIEVRGWRSPGSCS